ncbi:hypothetical protein, partial [Stenotrophomonas sp. PS02298]|uniref:hypothetical protein n=1 Tax=Stenotrophomonas sp. PS02298 TaxID=2991424 RepID=UPI002499DA14
GVSREAGGPSDFGLYGDFIDISFAAYAAPTKAAWVMHCREGLCRAWLGITVCVCEQDVRQTVAPGAATSALSCR